MENVGMELISVKDFNNNSSIEYCHKFHAITSFPLDTLENVAQ